jgi:uncharacterized membrane protein YhfC
MDYLVYFLGPLLLGVVGAKLLRQRFAVCGIGAGAFLLAWVVMQTAAGVASQAMHLTERSFFYGLIVAALAGVCEESTRFVVFRQFGAFARNRHWPSSTMYAVGHSGMETIIVGLTLLLIAAVLKYKPDAVSDPALLKQCRETLALAPGLRLYQAFERLLIGLLIHACFSAVVMLSFVRAQTRWVLAAGLWHFAHNLIGFNLHRLSDHWIVSKAWIAIIVVLYTWIFVRLRRALQQPPPVATPDATAIPPSMILPGRSAG